MCKIYTFIRSLGCNFLFFTVLFLGSVVLYPVSFLPAKYISCYWYYLSILLNAVSKNIAGIDYKLIGLDQIKDKNCIFAIRHESMWETMALFKILKNPIFILKKELIDIPFFGGFMTRMGMIAIEREQGVSSIRKMAADAKSVISNGRPLVIFPEGTRMLPSEPVKVKKGIAFLYKSLNVPVIPVALNSGDFWPKRSFLKRSGTIKICFLPPILPGLDSKEFLSTLEHVMSEKVSQLHNKNTV